MVRINGKEVALAKDITLEKYLEQTGYKKERLAVEINGDIVPKKDYGQRVLCDGDKIEIVSFVGGG